MSGKSGTQYWLNRGLTLILLFLASVVSAQAEILKFNATMTWGGSNADGSDADKLWSAYLANPSLASIANSIQYSQLNAGLNGRNYYNSDIATSANCAPLSAYGYLYGCSDPDTFLRTAIAPTNPGPAATASGQITIATDVGNNAVAVTGTLAVSPYDYRLADGSPFGNVWYGVTGGTLTLNLTGEIDGTGWVLDGGTAIFSNPDPDGAGPLKGFQCSTLFGGPTALTCVPNLPGMPGDYQTDGGQLSFLPIPIFSNTAGCSTVNTCFEDPLGVVSGVLATLTVDQAGNLSTTNGEYRRALASAAAVGNIYWSPIAQQFINNSTFYAGPLAIEGMPVAVTQANDDVASVLQNSANNLLTVLVNDTGFAGAIVTIAIAPDRGGTATVNPDNTIDYSPAIGFSGTETLGYTATAGADSDAATVTITVQPALTPTANNDVASVRQDSTNNTITVLSNDTDFVGPTVVTITTPLNLGGTATVNPDNTINYSPAAGFSGTETMGYTATAGSDSDTATVTIEVQGDLTPVAPAGAVNSISTVGVAPDTRPGTVNLATLATFNGGNTPFLVTVTNLPVRGTTSISGSTITFTPGATYFSGTDTFGYTITDADGDMASNAVTVTIADVLPTISDLTISTDQDRATSSLVIFTLGNGSRAQHVLAVQSDGAHGSCTLAGDNLTYTPQPGFTGNDACNLRYADGDSPADFVDVEITVNKAVDPNFRPSISATDPLSMLLIAGLPLLRRRGGRRPLIH
jgi:hypothetical protein